MAIPSWTFRCPPNSLSRPSTSFLLSGSLSAFCSSTHRDIPPLLSLPLQRRPRRVQLRPDLLIHDGADPEGIVVGVPRLIQACTKLVAIRPDQQEATMCAARRRTARDGDILRAIDAEPPGRLRPAEEVARRDGSPPAGGGGRRPVRAEEAAGLWGSE